MPRILKREEAQTLHKYVYRSEGMSVLEPPMKIFWNWLVTLFPDFLAPNVFTVVGLAVNVLSTLVLVYYSPDAKQQVPGWALILCGVCVFLYQTFDALDGCQWRRLMYDTPLEELFDHGCDSLSTVCISLGVSIALRFGDNLGLLLAGNLAMLFTFYIAQWQTFVCGVVKFEKIAVTEAQFVCMAVHFITAYCGSSVWDLQIPGVGVSLRLVLLCVEALSLLPVLISIASHLTGDYENTKGKNISLIGRVRGLCPFAIITLSAVVVQALSPSNIYEQHPCFYLITFGLLVAKVTMRIIVTSMVKGDARIFDWVMVAPCLLLLNQQLHVLDETYSLIFATVNIVIYFYEATKDICDELGIYSFTVNDPKYRARNLKEE